jgi:hypothetical protein
MVIVEGHSKALLLILIHYTSFVVGRKITGARFKNSAARLLQDRGGRV